MNDLAAAPFELGTIFTSSTPATPGSAEGLLGREHQFPNKSPSSGGYGPKTRRNERSISAIAVRNTSGIALTPGRVVRFKAGKEGREVDGYTTTTAAKGDGIVDPYLTGTVPDDGIFWLIVEGPVLMKTSLAGDAENVISVGSVLYALTAATSQATTAGRPVAWGGTFTATQTTDGTAANIIMNRFGRALSAKTTANTNADVLVDVNFLRR